MEVYCTFESILGHHFLGQVCTQQCAAPVVQGWGLSQSSCPSRDTSAPCRTGTQYCPEHRLRDHGEGDQSDLAPR